MLTGKPMCPGNPGYPGGPMKPYVPLSPCLICAKKVYVQKLKLKKKSQPFYP